MKILLTFFKWIHRFLKRGGGNILLPRYRFLFISKVLRTGLTDTFVSEISEGDVVVDVGANIGYYSILASERCGTTGRVLSFEPDPGHFALLSSNVKMNNCQNVMLEHKGVSNSSGNLKLYLSEANSSDHSTYEIPGRESIDVSVMSLDEYCAENAVEKVDFIKIDVQGFETAVLQGMYNLLERNRSVKVLSEFWPKGIERAGENPQFYLDEFERLGFEFYRICERQKPEKVSKQAAMNLALENTEIDLLMMRPN